LPTIALPRLRARLGQLQAVLSEAQSMARLKRPVVTPLDQTVYCMFSLSSNPGTVRVDREAKAKG
jgi:hypothetical protein